MSAHVLEIATELAEATSSGRPHLVLVPTGRDVPRTASRGQLRLTLLGRLVVALSVALVLVGVTLAVTGRFAAASQETRSVTVRSGQTLSEIAARELPDLAVSDGVVELQLANALSTSQVHAGQTLLIPAR